MLKFSANISTMFTEFDFLERFKEAKKNGFEYVEIQQPYKYDSSDIASVKSGLQCTLINSFGGTGMGNACVPGQECQFLTDLHKITPYYNALGVETVHILAGMKDPNFPYDIQLHTYIENLKGAVSYLENQEIVGVIEPICPVAKENYFLSSFETAVEVIKEVDSDYLKLLLDVYHLHMIHGDVEKNLEKYYPYAGHIQVSQDPDRYEPFHPDGKINYEFVFKFLADKGYSRPIGLEYYPSGATVDSLDWIKKYQ